MKQKLTLNLCAILFACLFIFTGTSSFAQEASKQNDPLKTYMLKRPNSPAVKLLQANPNKVELAKAVKVEMILENPGGYPEFSAVDLDRMRNEMTIKNQELKLVNEMMEQGATYDQAKSRAQQQSKSNGKSSNQEVPAMMVAPQ
ncbi:MAG: hypothetical protein ACK560_03270 [Bacteroidota bacterium]